MSIQVRAGNGPGLDSFNGKPQASAGGADQRAVTLLTDACGLPLNEVQRYAILDQVCLLIAVALAALPLGAFGGEGLRVGEEVTVCAEGLGDGIRGTPHVAFGNGCYLAVWREGFSGEGGHAQMCAARLNPQGKVLDPKPFAIAACKEGFQELPRVGFGGGVFLVVWQDFRNGKDYDVLGARVSPEGRVLDAPPIAIANGPRNQAVPDVASDGKSFLVAWQSLVADETAYRIFTARIGAEGPATPAGEVKNPWAPGVSCPRLAWDGTNYRVAFVSQGLLTMRLAPDGQPLAKDPVSALRQHLGAAIGFAHSVAATPGRGMLTVCPRSQPDYWGWGGPGAMIAYLIGMDGKLDAGTPKEDYPQAKLAHWLDFGKEKNEGSPWPYGQCAVAWDGQRFVAVWQRHHITKKVSLSNSDLIASRVDGWRPLDGAGVPVAASPLEEKNPALASAGGERLLCLYEKHDADGRVTLVARVLATP